MKSIKQYFKENGLEPNTSQGKKDKISESVKLSWKRRKENGYKTKSQRGND